MTNRPFKYIVLVLLSLLTVGLAQAQSGKQYTTVAARKAFFARLAGKYNSPAIQQILKSDTENAFEDYVTGHSEEELIGQYDVVVHELLHGFNSQHQTFETYSYLLGQDERIEVPMIKVYSSRELNQYVRSGLQDSIFRYGLYVGGKKATIGHQGKSVAINSGSNDLFSVQAGIYGLLDEYSAYYFGTLAIWELRAYFKDHYDSEAEDAWSDYKHTLLGNATAYYEFRLFIAWYLMYCQENHPEIHAKLLANHPLRQAFTKVNDRFRELIGKIEKAIPELDKLCGTEIGSMMSSTGTDEELRAFLAENDIDPDEMGLKPGSPAWESLREQYLAAVNEMKSSVSDNIEFFHSQPEIQWVYLKKQLRAGERQALTGFRVNL